MFENNSNFKIIGYIEIGLIFLLADIIITHISRILFSSILGLSNGENLFELVGILEIIIIFSMSYIFEYGYEFQKDSNGKYIVSYL